MSANKMDVNGVVVPLKTTPEDSSVTTPKIVDKAVTKTKLSDDVQESLDKADSAVSYEPQTLTEAQQIQAKKNLDLYRVEPGFSITWDGRTDGHEILMVPGQGQAIKVSDETPSMEAMKGSTLMLSEGTKITLDTVQSGDNAYVVTSDGSPMCIVAMEDGASVEGITFPHKGTWFPDVSAFMPGVYIASVIKQDHAVSTWEKLVDYVTEEAVRSVKFDQGDNGQNFDSYTELMVVAILQPLSEAAEATDIHLSFENSNAWWGHYKIINAPAPSEKSVAAIVKFEKTGLGIIPQYLYKSANKNTINGTMTPGSNTFDALPINVIWEPDVEFILEKRFTFVTLGCWTGTPINVNSRFIIYGKK